MKIILSNYRYFISGGPEKYLFNIKKILENHNHHIYPFSVKSKHNNPSEYTDFFLSPISKNNAVYAQDYDKSFMTFAKSFSRQFYCVEGFLKARKFANFIQPDLVYSLHFLNKMSPSVIDGFKSQKIPVVLRISDFAPICPQSHFFHANNICTKCASNNLIYAIKNKCIQNSYFKSTVKVLSSYFHKFINFYNRIDAFVFPSTFTMNLFIQSGFPESKCHHIPTFINIDEIQPKYNISDGYILYFGRFSKEKGLHQLIEAYNSIKTDKPRLVAIGSQCNDTYTKKIIQNNSHIDFYNFLDKDTLSTYIKNSLFVVIPSRWYDNMPNTILEAYAHGKAVIAPRHGSFLDLIQHKNTGLFYDIHSDNSLSSTLTWAIQNNSKLQQMGFYARNYAMLNFTPEIHYKNLLSVFKKVL